MTGCLLGPFVATSVASSRWCRFYAFPLGLAVANLALVLVAFRDSLRLKPAAKCLDQDNRGSGSPRGLVKATLSLPGVWLLCNFFFFHVGSVVTIGGWVVEYLIDVRGGDLSKMGYIPVGFNGGALLGRLLLAEPTYRFGERNMVLAYCFAAIALQLVFWLVPSLVAASVSVCLLGFFTGPFVPTGISLASKLFPPHLHSTALGFVFVFAAMGGSLFPIITGVIASKGNVSVLQPILTGLFSASAIGWFMVPRPKCKSLPDEDALDSD
ncbi:Major facilitator superfamily domain, general substrate transporter [Ophiocordyceps sinensis CO18]|nr:Major facilitator superfamily domain, general substrate transporter [Ophiocordyceps sinensis CO18]